MHIGVQKTHKNTQIRRAYVRQGLQGADKKKSRMKGRGEKIGQDVPNVGDFTLGPSDDILK